MILYFILFFFVFRLTETSLICPSSFNTNDLSSTEISLRPLYRSKSLIYNKEQIKKTSSRSYSLTSIKFDTDENKMLRYQSKIPKSIGLTGDNYSMPMIVNVEENVQINNQRFKSKIFLSPMGLKDKINSRF